MIRIEVTARAARQVRALAAEHAQDPGDGGQVGLRVAVDREAAPAVTGPAGPGPAGTGPSGAGPAVRLSLSTRRAPTDRVLPRSGIDVLVDDADADDVDGLRIDFVITPQGSGFVVDHLPRHRPAPAPPGLAAPQAPGRPSPAAGSHPDANLPDRVREALDRVRPALRADGGDVELVAVDGDVAYLRLRGACQGCAAAAMTLTRLVERVVLAAVPEVSRTVLVA
ncbi:MAG TPA: NifU family protein [Kineosporiaceae bacterium]